jgi:predicted O-methyltransferase YrrM
VSRSREEQVDELLAGFLLDDDEALAAALRASAAAGLPSADVSPLQGRLLQLLARLASARTILELGTLAGYSTIWLARALPPGGRLVSLELEPAYAEVARANVARAGLADRVEIRTGPAADGLAQLAAEGAGPFDLVFVDADKRSNAAYVRRALGLSRPGTLIVVDNVVRGGAILDPDADDPSVRGVRELLELVRDEPRLSATALQTVGVKGWDGLVVALVEAPAATAAPR